MKNVLRQRFETWIGLWLDIAADIVGIVSLTRYIPSWYFQWVSYCQIRRLKKQIAEREQADE